VAAEQRDPEIVEMTSPVGLGRVCPALVAITSPSGYGCSASLIIFSASKGPYASAVSMKFTPRSTARRTARSASALSATGPHASGGPVSRIDP